MHVMPNTSTLEVHLFDSPLRAIQYYPQVVIEHAKLICHLLKQFT